MRGRRLIAVVAAAVLVPSTVAVITAAPAFATVFSNSAAITLNDPNSQSNGNNNATASPYPATIAVSGLTGTVNHVAVTLNNVSYSYSQDIDALLVGPGGQKFIVVANLGPSSGSHAVSNGTLTLSDAGTLPTGNTSWGSSSTFKPVNFGGFNEVWESPAPAGPYADPGTDGTGATFASTFNGTNPNGTWSLYVITTSGGDGTGAIAGGWSLDVTTANAAATTTTVSSNNNPSFTAGSGSSVTLTSTVKKTSDSSNVAEGTVNFTDGGVTISGCGAVAVGAGAATCTTNFSTEGNHSLVASYSGTANFGPSNSATLTQVVNNHTTVTGSNFCNTGSITLNNPPNTLADATPYPSNVFTSGISGTVNHVAVTLNNTTYSHSQDIDALLVGPGGQTLILVANLGPNSGPTAPASNSTVTFSDAGVLPPAGMETLWGSSSTFKPVNYGGFNETWGPPAPHGPYGDPGTAGTGSTFASVFNGGAANGTWSLYVITTASGDGMGAIAGGWCLDVTGAAATAASTTTVSSDNNPSFTSAPGNGVTFTASVHKASDSSAINEGTVAFTDAGNPISGCTAVAVAAGQATCATAFSTQGTHPIVAQYSGSTNFGGSSASLSQVVNNHTTVVGNNFCNTGSIVLNNPPNTVADATPYPSNIFVSGRPGNLLHLSVTLNNTNYSHSQDIDVLLVGPGGQTLILVANLGPNSGPGAAASNSTLTLDDNGVLPQSGQPTPWGSSPTFKPVNYGGFNETWGPPAPPGPHGDPGTAGTGATLGGTYNGASPNGTWSLYAITTAAGDGTGAIAGGWCLNLTTPSPPTLTKTFSPAAVPLNGSTALKFTVANPNSASSLTGIGFTDTLPAGVVVSTPNDLTGSCGGGTITSTAGSGTVSLSGATLASSATCTFSVSVTGVTGGSKVNT
ncbi:MAG: Ig-like domain-containing protein, partial [Actinomycetota bacterium]|nr:Ig-like domain-containing protein [Actinomycetota bacterium]